MDRCKDYFGFVVWFAGIGYAVLWPFSASGEGGYPFGAAIACGHAGDGVIAALCELPHSVALPLGLHLVGFAATTMVAASVALRLLDRWRLRPGVIAAEALNVRLPGAIPARPFRQPARRLRTVKPRAHFGLRGMPR